MYLNMCLGAWATRRDPIGGEQSIRWACVILCVGLKEIKSRSDRFFWVEKIGGSKRSNKDFLFLVLFSVFVLF